MSPVPAELLPEFWNQIAIDCMITVTCLLPNGIIVLMEVSQNATLAEIKEVSLSNMNLYDYLLHFLTYLQDLWEEAAKLPLFGKLHDMSVYIFTYVNSLAEREKVNDESRRLSDIRPIGVVLTVTECRGEKEDDTINFSIGHLIGKRKCNFVVFYTLK